MCGHEIKFKDGKFIKDIFHKRQFCRGEREGLVTGWFSPTQSDHKDSIGIYDKNIIENSINGHIEDEKRDRPLSRNLMRNLQTHFKMNYQATS